MDNPSFRRSYERVDLANSKVQDVLKLRDGAADEATDEAEDEDQMSLRTRDHHVQAMEREPLLIPYNDNGDTMEVDLWRLCSVWPAKKPGELFGEKDKLPRYLFDERVIIIRGIICSRAFRGGAKLASRSARADGTWRNQCSRWWRAGSTARGLA